MEDSKYPVFYKKAIKGSVSGRQLDKRGDVVEFLLKGDPFNPNTDVDNITVEIKDSEAEKYFRRTNKRTISQGYLIKVSDVESTVNEVNSVSDGFLKDLLKEPFPKMKKRVNEFTSPVPVNRLLEFAREENKPIKTIQFLETTLAKLQDVSTTGDLDTGNVKVTTV